MKINFNLENGQVLEKLHSLLNPNFTEEGSWTIDYIICEISTNYVIVKSLENNSFYKISYSVNEEEYSLGEREIWYMIPVSETEKKSLEAVKAQNSDTFEKAEEIFARVQELIDTISNLENKISILEQNFSEATTTISTLTVERDRADANYNQSQADNTALAQEVEELRSYKVNVENNEKFSLIASYTDKLSEEILENYREKVSDFSLKDLEKDLAFDLVKTNPSIFSNQSKPQYTPHDDGAPSGIEMILNKYKKN